jgi:hypothetical protein
VLQLLLARLFECAQHAVSASRAPMVKPHTHVPAVTVFLLRLAHAAARVAGDSEGQRARAFAGFIAAVYAAGGCVSCYTECLLAGVCWGVCGRGCMRVGSSVETSSFETCA